MFRFPQPYNYNWNKELAIFLSGGNEIVLNFIDFFCKIKEYLSITKVNKFLIPRKIENVAHIIKYPLQRKFADISRYFCFSNPQ